MNTEIEFVKYLLEDKHISLNMSEVNLNALYNKYKEDLSKVNEYLHFYLGVECKVVYSVRSYTDPAIVKLTPPILMECLSGNMSVKPYLRQLSSITEEETRELNLTEANHGTDCVHTLTGESYRYLLLKGFDVFSLVVKGLAIDAETLKENQ